MLYYFLFVSVDFKSIISYTNFNWILKLIFVHYRI